MAIERIKTAIPPQNLDNFEMDIATRLSKLLLQRKDDRLLLLQQYGDIRVICYAAQIGECGLTFADLTVGLRTAKEAVTKNTQNEDKSKSENAKTIIKTLDAILEEVSKSYEQFAKISVALPKKEGRSSPSC